MSAGIDYNWIRRIRLTISGLSNTADKIFNADGRSDRLRISARIHKFVGIAEPAQIMVWNLSNDTRKGLQRQRTKIRIEAGWDHGPDAGLKECFYGDLQNAESQRSDPDIVTTMYALSGIDEWRRRRINTPMPKVSPWR